MKLKIKEYEDRIRLKKAYIICYAIEFSEEEIEIAETLKRGRDRLFLKYKLYYSDYVISKKVSRHKFSIFPVFIFKDVESDKNPETGEISNHDVFYYKIILSTMISKMKKGGGRLEDCLAFRDVMTRKEFKEELLETFAYIKGIINEVKNIGDSSGEEEVYE